MTDKQPLILLVDDEKDFIDIFGAKLSSVGYSVIGALSGEDALANIKEMKPDLILLDFNMPGLSGVDVLAKIKDDPAMANTKVAFLTNYGEPLPVKELTENDKRFAKEMGALDYIRKTDDLDLILKSVKSALEKK